jgi:hypothetical protein
MSPCREDNILSKNFAEKIEDTRDLVQGVSLPDEMLASAAISLKRIADALEQIDQRLLALCERYDRETGPRKPTPYAY